jgi:hypothetical protein
MNQPTTSPASSAVPALLITKLLPGGQGLAPALLKRAAIVKLDEAQSHQHELEVSDEHGQALKIQLPAGTHLHSGDVLVAEDGSLRRVDAPSHAGHDHHDHPHEHGHVHSSSCGHASHGKPIGIPVSAAPTAHAHQPHVHGPGCKH